MTTLAEAANLKGVFIPYVDYGFKQDDGPQFGEILFHCGEYRKRDNYFDDDDDLICYRFGYETEGFTLSPGDGLYFEIHPEIEIASEEWQGWLRWCLKKWEEDFEADYSHNVEVCQPESKEL